MGSNPARDAKIAHKHYVFGLFCFPFSSNTGRTFCITKALIIHFLFTLYTLQELPSAIIFDERWSVIEIEEQETQKYRTSKSIICCVAQNNKPAGGHED